MTEILFKDLCYQLNGIFFEVDNILGYGLKEEVYSSAIEELFKKKNISYKRELY